MRRAFLSAGLILLGAAAGLEAQGGPPVSVQGRQDLGFGELLGGLAHRVPPTDPANAAQFRIQGQGGAEFMLSFLLPIALTGPDGAALPLSFGPADGGTSPNDDGANQAAFDPRAPVTLALPSGQGAQRLWVFLGGTVLPPGNATLGAYSGTVTLTLATLTN